MLKLATCDHKKCKEKVFWNISGKFSLNDIELKTDDRSLKVWEYFLAALLFLGVFIRLYLELMLERIIEIKI